MHQHPPRMFSVLNIPSLHQNSVISLSPLLRMSSPFWGIEWGVKKFRHRKNVVADILYQIIKTPAKMSSVLPCHYFQMHAVYIESGRLSRSQNISLIVLPPFSSSFWVPSLSWETFPFLEAGSLSAPPHWLLPDLLSVSFPLLVGSNSNSKNTFPFTLWLSFPSPKNWPTQTRWPAKPQKLTDSIWGWGQIRWVCKSPQTVLIRGKLKNLRALTQGEVLQKKKKSG